MRKRLTLLIISVVALSTSCSNKLNVLAPYKRITVVYGLMDQSDTAHYIRVNKVFEGTNDAYTMASNFDSVYYPANQILVQLLCINSQGNQTATITLTPDSSIPLPAGIFPYPKQILYKTKAQLNLLDQFNQNNTYELVVTDKKDNKVLTGSTQLLPDAALSGLNSKNLAMSFFNTSPSKIEWNSSINGRIYQMVFRFYYYEQTPSGSGEQYFDWVFAPQTANTVAGGEPMEYDYTAPEFFQEVLSNIPIISGAQRRADSIRVTFTTGSDDFNTYIQLSQPSLGINQDVPSFSDVKNGIGIYTSRHTQTTTKGLTIQVNDTLVNGTQFAAYGFH
jgi:hypothetical protein